MSTETLEDTFADQRPRLLGLAYRITGSIADAEDVLQEAWMRMERTDASTILDPTGWLVTVVSRLALDELKRAHRRREHYVGPWLPEPVPTTDAEGDPVHAVELAESLTLAFLQLLDALSPAERVAFLLADVFGIPFAGIAEVLDRNEASCRQLASRARRRVREAKPAHHPPEYARDASERFIAALATGDVQGLVALLAPDVVLTSDGGPLVHAARRPVVGAERVGRFITNIANRVDLTKLSVEACRINHGPGVVVSVDEDVLLAMSFDLDQDDITAIRITVNPDKLSAFSTPTNVI